MPGKKMSETVFNPANDCWKGKEKKKKRIIFRNIVGELPFKGIKGLVELYGKLKDGVRLERPAHCSEEL